MISPTISLDLYRFLTDGSVTFSEALDVDTSALPMAAYSAELEAVFDDASWLMTAFDDGPSLATETQIVFGTGANALSIALSGVPPEVTEEQLESLLDSSAAGQYISGFSLVDDGTTILTATVGANSTTVTCGDQSATFTGSLTGALPDVLEVLMRMPGVFNEIFEEFDEQDDDAYDDGAGGGAASGGGAAFEGGDEEDDHDGDIADYFGYLGEVGFTGMTLSDNGRQIGEISISASELLFSYLQTEFALTGDFAAGDTADLLRLLGGALDVEFDALADLPAGITLTGMTITDSEGDDIFAFTGSYAGGTTLEFSGGTLTVNGTSGDDTDLDDLAEALSSGGLDEGEFNQVNVYLGAGADEFSVQTFRRAFQSDLYNMAIPDLLVHGQADLDTLEIDNIEEGGQVYDSTLSIDWTTGTIDMDVAFFDGDTQTAYDPGVAFRSIGKMLVSTFGDVEVTGNQYKNTLAFDEFGGDFIFDGGAGTDTLDFSEFTGGPEYEDSADTPMFEGDLTFGDFKTVARLVITGTDSYTFVDKHDANTFGTITSVETVVFSDGAGGSVSFDTGRLVDTRLMADLDGVLGGDILLKETSAAGGHQIASGLDGAAADFINRSSQTALAHEDFTGDGVADIFFEKTATGEKTILDGDSGAVISIGRSGQTFVAALDTDGDGTHEMLFRKSNGDFVHVAVDRNYTYEARYSRPNDTLLGVGDFDGDGDDDIALLKSDNTAVWIDTDTGVLKNFGQGTGPDVVGIGDTNGDGIDELIFERGNGVKYAADKSGVMVQKFGLASWTLVGVGDLNGDGADDLLAKKGTTYAAVDGTNKAVITQFSDNDTFLGLANVGFDMVDDMLFGDATLGLQVHEAGVGITGTFGWSGDSVYLNTATGLAGFDYELI